MLRSVSDLSGYELRAIDGNIGKVEECLFDDEHWTIRYLAVHTGSWLLGRTVLISPLAVRNIDWDQRLIDVSLTRNQVENSPDIDTKKPVSRHMEELYFRYYQWPYYWTGAGIWGIAPPPAIVGDPYQIIESKEESEDEVEDPHLSLSGEVLGYGIVAADSQFGQVTDFLFDDSSWKIRYLVAHIKAWLPSKAVLISPESVDSIDWREGKFHLHLSVNEIKNARKYAS